MLGSMAIKKSVKWGRKAFHPLLTIFLLLMICAWSFNPLLHYLYPPEERLYLKKEISKELFLYEIVYIGSAGTPDSYRYYFAGNLHGNPIPILDKEDPFLITNTGKADISYIGTDPEGHYLHLLVKYSGRIFLFYNKTIAPFSGLHRDILLSLENSFPIKNDDEDETLKLNKKEVPMPNSIVIKKKRRLTLKIFHFFLTIFLLLVIFVWSLNSILFYLFPMDEEVCFKKEISSGLWLYEVALLTNATAVDTYSFYLAPKIEGNPIKILEEKAPFLRGTAKKADISLIGTNKNVRYPHIMVKYHGKILEFHNLASTAHHDIFISLDAPYPVKDYRGN